MKRSFFIVLGYMLLLQLVMPLLVLIPFTLLQLVQQGQVDRMALLQQVQVPAHLMTGLVTIGLSWWYENRQGRTGSWCLFPGWKVLAGALLSMVAVIVLLEPLLKVLGLSGMPEGNLKPVFSSVAGMLAMGVTGPVAEELVFRKHVMDSLDSYKSPALSIVFSALLFAVVHGNLSQAVPAFLLGILFGWLYFRTGSILLVSVLHIVNNMATIILTLTIGTQIELIPDSVHGGFQQAAYLAVFLLLAASVYSIRKHTRTDR